MLRIIDRLTSTRRSCPVCDCPRVFFCRRRRPIGGPKYTIICFNCGRKVREYRHKQNALQVFFRPGAA